MCSCINRSNFEACDPFALIVSKTLIIHKDDSLNLSDETLSKIDKSYVVNYSRRNYFARYQFENKILIVRKLSSEHCIDLNRYFKSHSGNVKQDLKTCYAVNKHNGTSYNLRKELSSKSNYSILLFETLNLNEGIRNKDTIFIDGTVANFAIGDSKKNVEEIMFFNENVLYNKPVKINLMIVNQISGLYMYILYSSDKTNDFSKLELKNLLRNKKELKNQKHNSNNVI